MDALLLHPIGIMHSPFKDRFGIPRQPGLLEAARGVIELLQPCNVQECVRDLESFSHIWVLFHFHALTRDDWHATVRPPRLGGNRRVGVFASRSPFRPNPLGLSVLRLDHIDVREGRVDLHVSGLDLLDGTPILDIKPYVPYVDAIPEASPGFAGQPPSPSLNVSWSAEARRRLRRTTTGNPGELEALITQMLALDPRPAYHAEKPHHQPYRMRIADVEVEWRVSHHDAIIVNVHAPES